MQAKSYWCVRPVWCVVKSQILKTWWCLARLPSSIPLLGRDLDDDQFGVSLGGEPGALLWGAVPVAVHWTQIHAIGWPCKLRDQTEGLSAIQLGVSGRAQHLLPKAGDYNLVFRALLKETLVKKR